jgi:hypothetical protein
VSVGTYLRSKTVMSVAHVLRRAGLTVVNREEVDKLRELTERLYVDNRRQRQVETLDEVREIVSKF